MKPDKLRKLLTEIETRLARTERSLTQLGGHAGGASIALKALSRFRTEVARQKSKVDTLRIIDVENLERQFSELRDVAGNPVDSVGPGTEISEYLRSIYEDQIGLLNLTAGLKIGLNQIGPDDVLDALPGQKTAAFQYGFQNDILVVVDQPLAPNVSERDMGLAAIETAVEQGEYVNEDLARTNAAPRVKDSFLSLQATMSSYKNVVQIGARALVCNRLVQSYTEELSPTLLGLLVGHIETVFAALAQFEDWRIYSENAVALNIDMGSVARLAEQTSLLVEHLKENDSIDAAVTDSLELAADWVRGQDHADKRDVLSLARSLENIWSVIAKAVLSMGKEVISEARKRVAQAILVILLGAPAIVPILGKIPGAQWVETTYTYFKANVLPPDAK